MVLLCLNIILKMFVFISDMYTFSIFSVSDTLSCFRLFTCLQRQFIFSLLSVYYPYLKPWAVVIHLSIVYFGLFFGYFWYMILYLYVFYFFLLKRGEYLTFIWYHLISIQSSKFYLIAFLLFFLMLSCITKGKRNIFIIFGL